MLGKTQTLVDVNWENLVDRVGRPELDALVGGATLIGMLNWTMLPRMGEIWEKLLSEVLPAGPRSRAGPSSSTWPTPRSGPGKTSGAPWATVTRFQEHVEVILGLNLKEADPGRSTSWACPPGSTARRRSRRTPPRSARALGVNCVVIHPRKAAAAATSRPNPPASPAPSSRPPRSAPAPATTSTPASAWAEILGLGLEESLCAGVALQRLLRPDGHERLGGRTGRLHRGAAGAGGLSRREIPVHLAPFLKA